MQKTKKRILIVDDHPPTSNALTDAFSDEEFEVLKGKNGEEGLKLALEEKPDLILLDLKMPKMDGITMLKKLRADNLGKDIPVMILTNLNEVEKIASALKGKVYDYLIKSDQELEDIVKKVKVKLGQ